MFKVFKEWKLAIAEFLRVFSRKNLKIQDFEAKNHSSLPLFYSIYSSRYHAASEATKVFLTQKN